MIAKLSELFLFFLNFPFWVNIYWAAGLLWLLVELKMGFLFTILSVYYSIGPNLYGILELATSR